MKEVTAYGTGSGRVAASRRGFTTIELVIALVIVGVLLAVALPNFQSSLRKSRRAEAISWLTTVQQAQERHRSNNGLFAASLTDATTATPPGLAMTITRTTPGGYYDLGLSGASSTGYVATATAVTGTSQDNDGNCKVMGVQVSGGNIRYGAGATSIDWSATDPDSQRCWAR